MQHKQLPLDFPDCGFVQPCVLRVDILRGLSLYGDANFGSQDLFARAVRAVWLERESLVSV